VNLAEENHGGEKKTILLIGDRGKKEETQSLFKNIGGGARKFLGESLGEKKRRNVTKRSHFRKARKGGDSIE